MQNFGTSLDVLSIGDKYTINVIFLDEITISGELWRCL